MRTDPGLLVLLVGLLVLAAVFFKLGSEGLAGTCLGGVLGFIQQQRDARRATDPQPAAKETP